MKKKITAALVATLVSTGSLPAHANDDAIRLGIGFGAALLGQVIKNGGIGQKQSRPKTQAAQKQSVQPTKQAKAASTPKTKTTVAKATVAKSIDRAPAKAAVQAPNVATAPAIDPKHVASIEKRPAAAVAETKPAVEAASKTTLATNQIDDDAYAQSVIDEGPVKEPEVKQVSTETAPAAPVVAVTPSEVVKPTVPQKIQSVPSRVTIADDF